MDGAIYARGATRDKHTVDVQLGSAPYKICERAHEHALRVGLEAEFIERDGPYGNGVQLYLRIAHPEPVFAGLPKYRDRALPEDASARLLQGYFQVSTEIALTRDSWGQNNPEAGAALIRVWRPGRSMDDVLLALKRLGVDKVERRRAGLNVSPRDYAGVEALEELRDLFHEEESDLLEATDGKRPVDFLSDQIFGNGGNKLHVIHSIMDRRHYVDTLLENASRGADQETMDCGQLVYDDLDEAGREVYWDYQVFLDKRTRKPVDRLDLDCDLLQCLKRCYDLIIGRCFPASNEHATLVTIADTIIDGKARGYGESMPRKRISQFLPDPVPRASLMDKMVEMIRPQWFKSDLLGDIRLKPHNEILGTTEKATHRRKAREHIEQIGSLLFSELGTLTFSPGAPLPGNEVLRHCTSCDEVIVLTNGASCRSCGTGVCIDCEPVEGEVACNVHVKNPKKKTGDPFEYPVATGRRASDRFRPTIDDDDTLNELKVLVTKQHHLMLHNKKFLTGKTFNEMVNEALSEYFRQNPF